MRKMAPSTPRVRVEIQNADLERKVEKIITTLEFMVQSSAMRESLLRECLRKLDELLARKPRKKPNIDTKLMAEVPKEEGQ